MRTHVGTHVRASVKQNFRGKKWQMDPSVPKPRVNSSMMPKYVGQYVCVVGKNMGVAPNGASLQVETCDKQKLTAHFQHPLRDPLTPYVELVGRVEQDCSLSVERFVNFGSDFDLEAYNEVIQLAAQFPDIFPTPSQPMQY